MKCAVFAAVYLPYKGGYTESIHGLFSRLAGRGSDVTVITCNTHNQPDEEVIDGVSILRMPCWNPSWLNKSFPIPQPRMRTLNIIRKVFSGRYDIISTQTRFFPTSWLGFCIGKITHTPVVHTERGATHSVISFRAGAWIAAVVDHTLGWMIAHFSDKTIGVSQASCDFLKHIGARDPTKIYNGVDIHFWKNQDRRRGPSDEIVITFVGRLIFAKGVQDLLQALANLKQTYNQGKTYIRVNIIGDGPYRSELEQLSQQLNVQDTVTFCGEMSQLQIRNFLWQSDIFVNPSHSEGLPRSVMEAAAAGLPIVATDTGGTKEIVPEEILVPPKDAKKLAEALDVLVQNIQNTPLDKKNEAAIMTYFSWDTIVTEYEHIFTTL